MMKNCIALLALVLLVVSGCEKEESLLPNEGVLPTTGSEAKVDVSEDIDIDEAFLQERYRGKTVLTWVYSEINNMSEEDRSDYGKPLGMKYITNAQIIKLNDYLMSKKKEYVICFKKLSGGDAFAEDINDMVEAGEAPEFIFAEWYLDDLQNPWHSSLAYDLIGEGLLENLQPYMDKELNEYAKTLPENAIKLSSLNGKFYGYNLGISMQEKSQIWYVNSDLADEYDVDIDAIGKGGYEEWMDTCDIVYEGEKAKESPNFLIYEVAEIKPLQVHNIAGAIGSIDRASNVDVTAFGVTTDGQKVENYYAIDGVKQAFKEVYECKKKGYFDYLNENENDNIKDANLFITSLYTNSVTGVEMEGSIEENMVNFPNAKNFKELEWGEGAVNVEYLTGDYSVNGICSKSDEKELAIEAYDFINSDMEASNIIKFPEYDGNGREYNITENQYCSFFDREENKSVFERRGYKFTNPFVANPFADDVSIEEYKKNVEGLQFNEKYIDKYFDFAPVKKEIKNIAELEEKYIGYFDGKVFQGNFDDEWDKFIKELDNAGMQEVLDYLNKQ